MLVNEKICIFNFSQSFRSSVHPVSYIKKKLSFKKSTEVRTQKELHCFGFTHKSAVKHNSSNIKGGPARLVSSVTDCKAPLADGGVPLGSSSLMAACHWAPHHWWRRAIGLLITDVSVPLGSSSLMAASLKTHFTLYEPILFFSFICISVYYIFIPLLLYFKLNCLNRCKNTVLPTRLCNDYIELNSN